MSLYLDFLSGYTLLYIVNTIFIKKPEELLISSLTFFEVSRFPVYLVQI